MAIVQLFVSDKAFCAQPGDCIIVVNGRSVGILQTQGHKPSIVTQISDWAPKTIEPAYRGIARSREWQPPSVKLKETRVFTCRNPPRSSPRNVVYARRQTILEVFSTLQEALTHEMVADLLLIPQSDASARATVGTDLASLFRSEDLDREAIGGGVYRTIWRYKLPEKLLSLQESPLLSLQESPL